MRVLLLFSLLFNTTCWSQNYQYLGTFDSQGKPDYLVSPSDVVDATTMTMIDNSLPESFPVPDYNPHYIAAGYDTDIIIKEDADIWVTFVTEGAGYRNVLGFYTYDLSNPPTTAPNDQSITIIFPNASAQGSGGSLNAGDKVHLGRFSAGTGIGWVLLANAWNPSSQNVGYGLWRLFSNPNFNPESQVSLKHHNVLLQDPENERVILGFEDILRDQASCDNDFNDAIFYVTANPYTAIQTENFAQVSISSTVTSANNGGLESNGDLASLIAQRNFNRHKSGHVISRKLQEKFTESHSFSKSGNSSIALSSLLPTTGMYGTEIAQIATPTDLVNVTNADDVFAVDYYNVSDRVAAVLASTSTGAIYDHSKVICDRLNSSKLKDIISVPVRGHQIISSTIERADGTVEYSLSFSVKLGTAENELYSKWEIAQYPAGDYLNFQIWGNSYSQVFAISNHIIDALTAIKPLLSDSLNNSIPPVFVSSGSYSNGALRLEIINKIQATSINFEGNLQETESSNRLQLLQTIALDGNRHQNITIPTGELFDIGFSIAVAGLQKDALYLADGPWGVDYLPEYATLNAFDILPSSTPASTSYHKVERNPYIAGEVKGNINLFRHLKPGEQTLDVSNFNALKFSGLFTQDMEIILVPDAALPWDNRYKLTLPAQTTITEQELRISDFVNRSGQSYPYSDVKTIVFSIISDYATFIPFELELNDVVLGTYQETLSIASLTSKNNQLKNAPNPFITKTTVYLNDNTNQETVTIFVYDLSGRMVDQQKIGVTYKKQFEYLSPNLQPGIYKYVVKDGSNQKLQGSFLIK